MKKQRLYPESILPNVESSSDSEFAYHLSYSKSFKFANHLSYSCIFFSKIDECFRRDKTFIPKSYNLSM